MRTTIYRIVPVCPDRRAVPPVVDPARVRHIGTALRNADPRQRDAVRCSGARSGISFGGRMDPFPRYDLEN